MDGKQKNGEMFLPLWRKYPQIPQGSIGWRMGSGEAYSCEYIEWYQSLTPEEKEEYNTRFPEPVCWSTSEWNIKRHNDFWIYNWKQPCVRTYSVESIIEKQNAEKKCDYVFFWGHKPKQGEEGKEVLSQWYMADFYVGHLKYCCMEQYMMAKKAQLFGDVQTEKQIMETSTQKEIKSLGRKVKNFDEAVWNEFKSLIVMTGNYYKFSQIPRLQKYLLSTKDAILVEASPYDRIWGIGMAQQEAIESTPSMWRGLNLLGFALMTVRDELFRICKE